MKKRIDGGSLSDRIHERVEKKAQKTDFKEAVVSVYSSARATYGKPYGQSTLLLT